MPASEQIRKTYTSRKPALKFGSFISPTAADPEATVRLAVVSEEVGLDLVTFQDHPYQVAFLDTWTLLSFVAARTERITVASDVLNLPLRPPAMLARASASLDLLSGGRFVLGLGAGFFWDSITTMGVERRTPGESVTALEEAVDLIRTLWNTREREPIHWDGAFYHLDGARPGPQTSAAIPVWLGGYKPRLLGVIGRLGNGWISSWGLRQSLTEQRHANLLIDEVAIEAGRDPLSIRRAINIPPDAAEASTLAHLANIGFDTFILMSDSESQIRYFATTTVPATRHLLRNTPAGVSE